MNEKQQLEKQIQNRLIEFTHHQTDWALVVDAFINWLVDTDFSTESYRLLVDYVLVDCDGEPLKEEGSWDFFFGYDRRSDETFIQDWVVEDEVPQFLEYYEKYKRL